MVGAPACDRHRGATNWRRASAKGTDEARYACAGASPSSIPSSVSECGPSVPLMSRFRHQLHAELVDQKGVDIGLFVDSLR
jgi:hypothetical protein